MKSTTKGFTLIELMITVAIVAILAATALPAYQGYTVRAKLSEVILALGACRTTITETYQAASSPPGADNWGCENVSSKYVVAFHTDANGVVSATIGGIHADVNGKVVTMIPLGQSGSPADSSVDLGKGIRGWLCGSTGTTLDKSYLPSSCRG